MLYFDPRFSETGTVSCFSCHNVMEGADDHRPTSIGVHGQEGGRNAPTVWNAAKAIASYERTLITPGSAYDRYMAGDKAALTAQQVAGMNRFREIGCTACHQSPAFAGPLALSNGTPFLMKFPTFPSSPYVASYDLAKDLGRFESAHREEDRYMWRVPTLRNLGYTAPYMHSGSVKTLPEAVRVMASTQLNRTLSDQEVSEIVAFLDSLNGPFPSQEMPHLPPTPGDLLQRGDLVRSSRVCTRYRLSCGIFPTNAEAVLDSVPVQRG